MRLHRGNVCAKSIAICVVAVSASLTRAAVTYQTFAEAKAASASTSLTISTPSGASAGDLLIAAVVVENDHSGSLTSPAGEGWALIDLNQSGGAVTLGVWWKIVQSSEPGTHQFTWSGSDEAYGWLMRFTGHDVVAPIDAFTTNGGTSSSPTSPSVTTTIANTMILRIGGFDDDFITVDNPGLAGHTAITMDKSNASTTSCSGGAGYVVQAAVGSSGTSTFSLTNSEQYRTVTIAIAQKPTVDLTNGLIAFWKLNEGTGVDTVDSSPNTNDGTLANGAAWTDGVFGYAVNFDGNDDYIGVGSDSTIDDVFSGGATFTAWIYIEGAGGNNFGRLVDKADALIADQGWALQMNGGTTGLRLEAGFSSTNGVWTTANGSVSANSWYHIAMVWDSDSAANDPLIYVNGVSQTVTNNTPPSGTYDSDAAISMRLGNFAGGTNRAFDGSMDDLRLYNRELSTGEIVRLATGSGLIGHWKFDDGSGGTATDSADSHDGSLTGVPSWITGHECGALDFDGSNDYVSMGDVLDVGSTEDLTITGWFSRDTFNSDDTILAKRNGNGGSGDRGFIVYIAGSSDKLIFKADDGTDLYTITSSTTFTSAGWNHFAVTWDQDAATNCEIYINGVDDDATQSGTIGNIDSMSNGLALIIGAESDGGSKFDGQLDDIRIYDRALAPWQIQNLAATYQVVDLGSTTDEQSLATCINDAEQIAGFDETIASGAPTCWISEYSDFTDLGTLTGGSTAEAHDINAAGKIVGWSTNTLNERRAFLWTSGSGMTDLGLLTGRTDSEAHAINSSDEVVGTALDFVIPPKDRLAFLYLPSAKYGLSMGMNNLGTLGGGQSNAQDINDSGEVVGGAQIASVTMEPFIWLPSAAYGFGAGMNSLGTLGGAANEEIHRAEAINSSGKVVGRSYTAGGDGHAFYWESGTMTDMGVLSGGDSSWAFDINDSGVAVGTSNVTGGAFHAFIWDGSTMTDLNSLIDSNSGWTLTRATGINEDGEIVGWGTNGAGNIRAFILVQTCASTIASTGSIAAQTIAQALGTTDASGDYDDLVTDEEGDVLAEVRVNASTPGEPVTVTLTTASTRRGAPGPGIGTLAGFGNGVALDRTLIVESPSEAKDDMVAVSMLFDIDELDAASDSLDELQVHKLDTKTGIWTPSGKNVGMKPPTSVVGESGYDYLDSETVEYWTVTASAGVFGVGKIAPAPVDEKPPEVEPPLGTRLCGVALVEPLLLCSLTLVAARRRRRRCRKKDC